MKKVEKSKIKSKTKNKQKLISIIIFAVGLVICIAGLAFLLVNLFTEPGLRDAEYIIDTGNWARADEPSVIWNFTEIGKGTLTTNNHENDYDFIWAISGDTLEIETEWLYTLNDSYEYKIDQVAKTLTLTNGDEEIVFKPVNE